MRIATSLGAAVAAAAIVAGITTVSPAGAQQGDPSPDQGASPSQRTMSQTTTSSATVEKIDKAAGKITIKDTEDNTFDVKPGPEVKLDQLKVGDKVKATYYQEVAVAIGKPGQAPKKVEKTVERGGVTARQATVTAQIVSVDTKKNTVQVRGPQGTHTLAVQDPTMQAQLTKIKPGDNVSITYTQAVAVSMEPEK